MLSAVATVAGGSVTFADAAEELDNSPIADNILRRYALYMFVHHATHHFEIQPGDVLYRARARVRHMAHHYHDGGNFGVTTSFWDVVFGTTIRRGGRIAPA